MDPDAEVSRLRRKLESEDARERGEAAVEAGRLGDRRLVPSLIRAAAYDVGEYQISFGMVDEYATVSQDAASALAAVFAKAEPDEAELAGLLTAILDPHADEESVCFLLRSLKNLTWPLIEALVDQPEPFARRRAVLAGAARELLAGAAFLDDPAPEVRLAAISVLPRKLDDRGRAALARRIDDEHPEVRSAAARQLGLRDLQEPLLRRLPGEADPKVRCEIVRALGRRLTAEAVRALVARVGDGDFSLRLAAVRALEGVNASEVARAFFRRLAAETEDAVRHTLLSYRHYARHVPEALPFFVDFLCRTESEGDASSSARAASAFGPAAAPALIDAWPRMGDRAKKKAAYYLGELGDPRALTVLQVSADPDLEAARAKVLKKSAAARVLEDPGSSAEDLLQAIDELWRSNPASALPYVLRNLDHADPRVRTSSVWTLSAARTRRVLKDPAALLRRMGVEPDPSVRVQIVKAFYRSLDAAAIPALTAALSDPDPAVRAEAALVLGTDPAEGLGGR